MIFFEKKNAKEVLGCIYSKFGKIETVSADKEILDLAQGIKTENISKFTTLIHTVIGGGPVVTFNEQPISNEISPK